MKIPRSEWRPIGRRVRSIRLVSAAMAAAAALSLGACSSPPADDAPTTLTIAPWTPVSLTPASWNPAVGVMPVIDYVPVHAAYDVLIEFDTDGSWMPSLAKSYELNDDRTVVTLELRDDVDFVDGIHLDAAAVAKWFSYLLSDESEYISKASALKFGLEFVATGEYSLEIRADQTLFHPDYYVSDPLRLMLQTPVLSPAVVDDPSLANDEPMGSGPYRVESSIPDAEIVFVKNPDHWDADRFPYDTIVMKAIADPTALLNALKSGEVDAAPLTVSQVAEAEASGLTIVAAPRLVTVLRLYNPFEPTLEPLRDVRVRQAMAYAIDRDSIAEQIGLGYGSSSSQAFVEGMPEHLDGQDDRYAYDLDKARALMAEAGYADGFDLTIPVVAGTTPATQPIVEQSLADIGIRVTWEPIPPTEVLTTFMSGKYDVILTDEVYRNLLRNLDEPYGPGLRAMAQNDELDALLAAIRFGESDASAAASRELGERILEEGWLITVFHSPYFHAFDASKVEVLDATPWYLYHYAVPRS